ncbi:MAG: cell division protein FtsB [Ectothiorhodospiraceae bacterium]
MRLLIGCLVALLLVLQGRLWFGDGSVPKAHRLQQAVADQRAENDQLRERNQALEADVGDLKNGLSAVEERARRELGMVKSGETFYQVVVEDDGQ